MPIRSFTLIKSLCWWFDWILFCWKLEEININSRNQYRQTWEAGDQSMAYGNQNAHSQSFFQPLECNPTLQIG